MSNKQCPKCKVIGVGAPTAIGVPVPCKCLPKGRTCKDCKFEELCLLENVIRGPETICRYEEVVHDDRDHRGFALPGELSYREMWAKHWEDQARMNRKREQRIMEEKRKKEEAHQLSLEGLVYTEIMILEGILPHHLRKVYTELPEGVEPDNTIPFSLQHYLDRANDPLQAARMYLDVHAPSWRKMIGERLPPTLRGVFKGEHRSREIQSNLQRQERAIASVL